MKARGYVGVVAVLVAAGAVLAAYEPDRVATLFPPASDLAHRLHDAAFRQAGQTAPQAQAQANVNAGPPPALVSVAVAKRQDYPVNIGSLGQAQAFNTVTVRTRVDGEVQQIAFDEGQMVKAGDLIAQIDPRPFQATLDQAKAKQAQDQATLANAKLDLQRYATLVKQSFASQQQLDTQSALVSQLIAQTAADAAAVDSAQVQLNYTRITAPLTGRTGFRLVDQGNMVNASQQTGIVTIAQLQPIAVMFTAPQDDLQRINAAMAHGAPKVEVRTSDGSTLLATGKLIVVDNQVDAGSGSIRLKAEFENTDNALWPGLAVATSLTVDVDKNALVVPAVAIQRGPQGLFVYVVDDQNRAAMRPVTLSHQDINVAVIEKGVNEGDKVVTTGAYVLQPGSRVSIDANASSGS
ncbi:MAG: efflux RND transporter periplasmic adaptor subunit [Hyphomicrobiales bacterium]|nr:efflux RND transporter periplasmic adaptor subunit [Hyphomicrobiales bacterium]MBV8662467.1 efflux RND transporter periplasmic adaptor subunit [Hyphomicrobiales bacterium]